MKNRVIAYIKAKHSLDLVTASLISGDSKNAVVEVISQDVLNELGFGAERFEIETGIQINDLVKGIFEILAD